MSVMGIQGVFLEAFTHFPPICRWIMFNLFAVKVSTENTAKKKGTLQCMFE